MSGVFLSYAREDLPFVRRLHAALSAAARDPAWDQDHRVVPFGAPYRTEIDAAIAGSEKFIFVISPDSLDSDPCAEELASGQGEQADHPAAAPPRPRRPADRQGRRGAELDLLQRRRRVQRRPGELTQTLDTDLDSGQGPRPAASPRARMDGRLRPQPPAARRGPAGRGGVAGRRGRPPGDPADLRPAGVHRGVPADGGPDRLAAAKRAGRRPGHRRRAGLARPRLAQSGDTAAESGDLQPNRRRGRRIRHQ